MIKRHPKDTQPEVYQKLVEAIAENRAIAMVGAGSSVRVGFPNWANLLEKLSSEAVQKNPDSKERLSSLAQAKDDLAYASAIKEILGEEVFASQLKDIFGPDKPEYDTFHEMLVQLPFRHFLTTNYDRVLQTAYEDCVKDAYTEFDLDEQVKRKSFFDKLQNSHIDKYFVHVHGSIKRPEHIVLTLDDYNERYIRTNDCTEALKIIFALPSLVFIGFSFDDVDVMRLLQFLTACFGVGGEPKHFAILQDPGADKQLGEHERLRSRFRIEPLFYDNKDNHAALEPLLKRLSEDVAAKLAEKIRKKISFPETIENKEPEIGQPINFAQAIEHCESGRNYFDNDITTPDSSTRTVLDSEIDDIFKYVKNNQPEVAVEMYKRILVRKGDNLPPRLKYRLHANIGNAYCSMNKKKEAAEEYMIATDYWAETKEAQAIRALGHILKREFAEAYSIAERLCREHPDYPRPYVIRLQSQSPQLLFRDARREIPTQLRRNPEVAFALSGLADEQGLRRRQVIYASIAWKKSPDWIDAGINYAAALLMCTRDQSIINIDGPLIPHNTNYAQKAESILNRILEILPTTDPGGWRGLVHYNRATARRFLGRDEDASRDLEEAYRYNRNDPNIVAAYATHQERTAGINEAIRVIERCDSRKDNIDLSILLAIFLYQRSANNDLDTALSMLLPWTQRVNDSVILSHRYELLQITYRILASLSRCSEAVTLINNISEDIIPPLVKKLLLLEIQIDTKAIENEDAKKVCEELAASFDKDGEFILWRNLALCAEKIKYYILAHTLWERIVQPLYYNADTHRMLFAASHANKDDFVLTFCEQLRNNNIHNRKAYIHEIESLFACHEFNQAMEQMNAWLKRNPNDSEMRMNLSLLAAEFERKEYIETDPSKLPLVENVPDAKYGVRVVMALQHSTHPISAITYAYNLWRRYPDDIDAQHNIIATVHNLDSLILPAPKVIDCSSAIVYKRSNSDLSRTHIIEEGPSPIYSRDEYPPDHAISKALIGKKVGDSFVINKCEYTIIAIYNKYAYVASQLLKNFLMTFPDNKWIHEIHVSPGYDDTTEPQQALGEVKELFQNQETRTRRIEDMYQKNTLPVVTFAKFMGKSVLETMLYFAKSINHNINICMDSRALYRDEFAQLSRGSQIVLDETAIATLFMLGLHKKLKTLPYELLIPESAIHELRRIVKHAVFSKRSVGHLGMIDSQLVFHKLSPSEQARWIDSLEELIASLQHHCTIQGGKAILDFEPDKRKQLEKCLGPANVDAIAIAKEKGIAYWTDDFLSGALAVGTWGIQRVWTQIVLDKTLKLTRGFNRKYDDAVKNMFLWGYDFTAIGVSPIISLCKDAGWSLNDWRLQHVEDFIIKFGANNPHNCHLTCILIIEIWDRCPKKLMAIKLITNILDKIGRQISGPRIARPIYRSQIPLPQIRNVNSLKRMLRSWRQQMLK